MIPFDKAYEIVMGKARTLDSEPVAIEQALDRVLAEDVVSDIDMPPFNKSAMDGYACRRADLDRILTVVETIQAGYSPRKYVGPGECAKIMTGAPVPEGADCVIMIEHTEAVSENTVRFTGSATRHNICFRGEDINAGDVVLRKGDRLGPPHIAVLATVGCVRPRVTRRPRVGVIATGDELVEPGVKPNPSQIRTSNSYQLCAHATAAGAVPTYYGIAKDTRPAIDGALKRAMPDNDVILLSGGVSKGEFDLVPAIMQENGIEILFDAIAMKPGKPTTFGVSPTGYCFGLPGNPVSTFIQFELLVKPFLGKLMGYAIRPVWTVLPLAETISRKDTEREAWIPVTITDNGEVRPNEYHGSAHINALCRTDGLLTVPIGVASIEKGALVRVRPL
jgi:molybdopterin molybdotransferase